jgi:predicted DNA-binding protein
LPCIFVCTTQTQRRFFDFTEIRHFFLDESRSVYYNVLQKEGSTMSISLRLAEEDAKLFRSYASLHGITVSELVRQAVLERIEEEYDLQLFEEAMKKHRKNPVVFSHDEVCGMLEQDE